MTTNKVIKSSSLFFTDSVNDIIRQSKILMLSRSSDHMILILLYFKHDNYAADSAQKWRMMRQV